MTTLYSINHPQSSPVVHMVSERVPGGTWPAAVRAVIRCRSSSIFEDGRPRAIIQWGARCNATFPNRLHSISQYVTLDQSVTTVDGIGSVCLALFGSVPEQIRNEVVLLGRSCLITVGMNGCQKNRVIAHSALPPGMVPVEMPKGLHVKGDICKMDPLVFAKLDLPPSMREARLRIARDRGMI